LLSVVKQISVVKKLTYLEQTWNIESDNPGQTQTLFRINQRLKPLRLPDHDQEHETIH
jgi:hypothetical protein